MKTKEFLSILKEHQDKSLLFEYGNGQLVGANYHITEIKNITVDSVDCGARPDFWKETVIQLWESPSEVGKKEYLSAYKALGIMNKVEKIKPVDQESEVKFEYGNSHFHTAHLFVDGFTLDDDKLLIQLAVTKTDCKAKETCGVPVQEAQKKEVCCSPESGCC